MKKLLHKWLAMTLACVMALSCATFAAASDPNPLNGEGQVAPSTTGAAVIVSSTTSGGTTQSGDTQKVETKYAGGSAQGASRSEGPLPADPIRLELPTVGAKTLDMILDPHGLINRTGMARYSNETGKTTTFKEDTTLYFLNSITSGGAVYNYTDETQALTITNKSNLPVGVDVTLRVDKGASSTASGDVFEFVDDRDSLSTASGDDALMYLALKKGDDTYEVEDYDTAEDGDTIYALPTATISSADNFYAYIGATEPTTPLDVADSNYNQVTFQWAKVVSGDELVELVDTEQRDFISALGANGKKIELETTASGDEIDITATAPSAAYKVEVAPEAITNTSRDINVAVRYYKVSGSTETDVAFVYFVVKAGAIGAAALGANASGEILVEQGENDIEVDGDELAIGVAKFHTVLSKPVGAYVEGWDANGYFWSFVETTSSGDLVKWGHEDATAPTSYPAVSFSIVGAINGVKDKASPWDGQGSLTKLDLIWDVFAVDADAEGEDGGGANAGKATITGVTAATGTTSSTRNATISYTAGTGDYADYNPTVLVYGSDTIEVTAGSGSVTVNTRYIRDATTFALRFSNGTDSYDVPITDALWTSS